MILSEEQKLTMKAAQKGYERYCRYTGNKSLITGDILFAWDALPGEICNAWFAAADGIINFLAEQKLVHNH